MINAQLIARKHFTAVLAAVFIPAENIYPCEANLSTGHFVIGKQHNDPGNAYCPVNQANAFILFINPELCPAFKIKRFVLLVYCTGNILIKENKSPAH
jgi:hypothetical protein